MILCGGIDERKSRRTVISSSTALGANEGLGVPEIHGRVTFGAQRYDEKIESLKEDRRGQKNFLVPGVKGHGWLGRGEAKYERTFLKKL